MVILDEATAEAGSGVARDLDRAAAAVTGHRTCVVVAHRLSQAIDSALVRAWSAHDAIQRAEKDAGALTPALRDSLATLATRGNTSLAGAASALTDIAIGVQSADTRPPQGLREGYRACAELVDGLIERWQRLEPMLREAAAAHPNRP